MAVKDTGLIPFAFMPVPKEGEDVRQQSIQVELVDRSLQVVDVETMTRSEFFERFPIHGDTSALVS
jgi:hypothetical protein